MIKSRKKMKVILKIQMTIKKNQVMETKKRRRKKVKTILHN
tara:strand:- start:450 stop:572 length:123 start_codon:yes stop_codon:yes gene_type:complete